MNKKMDQMFGKKPVDGDGDTTTPTVGKRMAPSINNADKRKP